MNYIAQIIIAFAALLLIVVLLLRKGKLPVKYSLVWIFSAFLMIIAVCIPSVLDFFTKLLGFELASNFILSLFLGIVIFISIFLTVIVSRQSTKIKMLIQEISLLKEKIDRINEKNE